MATGRRTWVDADPEPERGVGPVSDAEVGDLPEQVERHGCHHSGVAVAVADRQSADDHVSVADRLDFVDVVAFDHRVEQRVQIV